MPVLLPKQRWSMEYQVGGIVRRAGLTLDDIFVFLPQNNIADAPAILGRLQAMAANETLMAERRNALEAVAEWTMFGTETMDDTLTVSLGLALAGESH